MPRLEAGRFLFIGPFAAPLYLLNRRSSVKLDFRLNNSKQPNGSKPEDICLACGLCCDGVIFAEVRLQPGDDPAPFMALAGSSAGVGRLAKEWAPPSGARSGFAGGQKRTKVSQPCVAFDGCKCRIYGQRPNH